MGYVSPEQVSGGAIRVYDTAARAITTVGIGNATLLQTAAARLHDTAALYRLSSAHAKEGQLLTAKSPAMGESIAMEESSAMEESIAMEESFATENNAPSAAPTSFTSQFDAGGSKIHTSGVDGNVAGATGTGSRHAIPTSTG